jgi:hypothetical protein
MIKMDKPINLNGKELREELRVAGVSITDDFNAVEVDGNGFLWLNINVQDESKAKAVVAAHNGTIVQVEPSIADKLASVGLSVADLKEELGL